MSWWVWGRQACRWQGPWEMPSRTHSAQRQRVSGDSGVSSDRGSRGNEAAPLTPDSHTHTRVSMCPGTQECAHSCSHGCGAPQGCWFTGPCTLPGQSTGAGRHLLVNVSILACHPPLEHSMGHHKGWACLEPEVGQKPLAAPDPSGLEVPTFSVAPPAPWDLAPGPPDLGLGRECEALHIRL